MRPEDVPAEWVEAALNATRIGAGFFKSDWDETVKAIAAAIRAGKVTL